MLRVYFPLLTVYLSPAQLEALFMFQKALVNTAREHTSKNCLLLLKMSLEIGCVFTHLYKTSFCRANTSSAKVKVWHPSHTHTHFSLSLQNYHQDLVTKSKHFVFWSSVMTKYQERGTRSSVCLLLLCLMSPRAGGI